MPKTVIITGISRGIGRACALEFARNGYCVAGFSLSHPELLTELGEELDRLCVPHLFRCGDAADAGFIRSFFEETAQAFGRLDLLINNVGISRIGLLSDLSDEDWDRILSVNLSSAFYCCRAAIPYFMKNQNAANESSSLGAILNVSSVWGCVGASCEAAYSATKGGLNSLTMALAKELAPSCIPVNALACGVIDTDMNRCFDEEERASLAEEIPAGRFATPSETAHALYLLSQMPPYMTGQIIRFDGGWQ